MKHLLQRAGTHFKRPGRFVSFEITADLPGASVNRAARSQIQALSHITVDAISDCIGVLVLLITALAIFVVQLAHNAPVILAQVGAAPIEARISSPVETLPFMYAGIRG
jgi:hypothetical protein